jgi:hypothetical protein
VCVQAPMGMGGHKMLLQVDEPWRRSSHLHLLCSHLSQHVHRSSSAWPHFRRTGTREGAPAPLSHITHGTARSKTLSNAFDYLYCYISRCPQGRSRLTPANRPQPAQLVAQTLRRTMAQRSVAVHQVRNLPFVNNINNNMHFTVHTNPLGRGAPVRSREHQCAQGSACLLVTPPCAEQCTLPPAPHLALPLHYATNRSSDHQGHSWRAHPCAACGTWWGKWSGSAKLHRHPD